MKTSDNKQAVASGTDSNNENHLRTKSAYYGSSGPSYSAEALEALRASQKVVRNTGNTSTSETKKDEVAESEQAESEQETTAGGSVSATSSTTQRPSNGVHAEEAPEDSMAWEEKQLKRGHRRHFPTYAEQSDADRYYHVDSYGSGSLQRIISRLKQFTVRSNENINSYRKELNQMKTEKEEIDRRLVKSREKVDSQKSVFDATQKFLNFVKNLCSLIAEKEEMIYKLEQGAQVAEASVKQDFVHYLQQMGSTLYNKNKLFEDTNQEYSFCTIPSVRQEKPSEIIGSPVCDLDDRPEKIETFYANLKDKSEEFTQVLDICAGKATPSEAVSGLFATMSRLEKLRSVGKVREEKLSKLVQARDMILNDVSEDYSSSSQVLLTFDEWRSSFPEHYKNMYTSLSLPSLVAPFARIEMSLWIPFVDPATNIQGVQTYRQIQQFEWFTAVRSFVQSPSALTEDREILEKLYTMVLVPRLESLIKHSFNPHDTEETETLLSILRQSNEMSDEAFRNPTLLKAVTDVFSHSLQDRSVPIVAQGTSRASEISNGSIYLTMSLIKLLYNGVQLWHCTRSDQLKDNLVENILGDLCLPAIQSIGETIKSFASQDTDDEHAIAVTFTNISKYLQVTSVLVSIIPQEWMQVDTNQTSSMAAILDVFQDSLADILKLVNLEGLKRTGQLIFVQHCVSVLQNSLRPVVRSDLSELLEQISPNSCQEVQK